MLKDVKMSLADITGKAYCNAVGETAKLLHGLSSEEVRALCENRVSFYSREFAQTQDDLLAQVGEPVVSALDTGNDGAPTDSFRSATTIGESPIGGIGAYRIGQNGRLYLASKSEHYHTPLGHNFPGYRLLQRAKTLGIMNATHNNTRGYITRVLERELVRTVNGIPKKDQKALQSVLESKERKVLNRVINLETGSLAVEAGIKMMLARFYKLDKTYDRPVHSGKTPVFLVMADNMGGSEANYHGTTVIAQTMRGMWPEFYAANEQNEIYKVVSVKINDIDDFEAKITQYNSGQYRTAGFLHEIVLMNYGGIRISRVFLNSAYALCSKFDTPTLADEIQSCMWYDGMYLFRKYGLNPDFVILGKGFSGGEYPASRIVTTAEMDSLNQFGALVTNGQEELASLAYLVTMAFAEANSKGIAKINEYYENALCKLADKHGDVIEKVEGIGLLSSIHFKDVDTTVAFTEEVGRMYVDISAHTYKADCTPTALMKPPLIMSVRMVDELISKLDVALEIIK